jgi:adenine-specific DNA-methyltransferase
MRKSTRAIRELGQVWTPDWVADMMAAYALRDGADRVLDPAVGGGALLKAASRHARGRGAAVALDGCDVDETALASARAGLPADASCELQLRDFALDPPAGPFRAIMANPPYVRHHRIPPEAKARLRRTALESTGLRIDGRAGLHVHFLVRCLALLASGGRLAFLVSADACEGVFASALWRWICASHRLDHVVTFAPEAAPFPGRDTNAVCLMIRKAEPEGEFDWIECRIPEAAGVVGVIEGRCAGGADGLLVHRRRLDEALRTGLTRPPDDAPASRHALGDFAMVRRGIVTGCNDFFFMTARRAAELGIPGHLFTRAVGRVRDVQGDWFGAEDLERLEAAGRPTRLLDVREDEDGRMPRAVQDYLRQGEDSGVAAAAVLKARRPWHRMERREVPPILFAYLGRRDAKFILNESGAVPLSCLLCVYPRDPSPAFLAGLWSVLSHPETAANLAKVGKSYGGGAIKVEPRALERLPLPDWLVEREGLGRAAA